MESPSLAALLISVLAFLDVAFSQDSQQLSFLLRGRPAFGDRSGFELGPRRYVFESGNALGAASDASSSYGAGRFGIVPLGFERDYTGREDGVENFGNSDTLPYGGSKRISRRRTIVIVIRRRRPRWQGGSGSEDDGGKWGRVDDDYPSDDQSTNERRRAGRALLGILLRKLLLAAASQRLASDGSDEGQGRDFRSEIPWRLSERGWRSGWRLGEGSDSGSTGPYDGRGSRRSREGLGAEGGRLLVRVIRPNDESSGFYLAGSSRGPQSGARWISSDNIGGASGGIPGISTEESGPISDTASSGAGYGVVRNMGRINTGAQGNPSTEMLSFLSGRLAGSRGFESSSESVTARPSTQLGPNTFEQPLNQAVYGNEDSSYGGVGNYYYPLIRPRLIIRLRRPFTAYGEPFTTYGQPNTGSPDGSYDGSLRGSPDTTVSTPLNSRYSSPSGGIPGGNPMSPREMNGPYSVSSAADESTPNVNAQLSQKS